MKNANENTTRVVNLMIAILFKLDSKWWKIVNFRTEKEKPNILRDTLKKNYLL